jgi:hypothetical protein
VAAADRDDRDGIVVLHDLHPILADDVEDLSFEGNLSVHAAASSQDG